MGLTLLVFFYLSVSKRRESRLHQLLEQLTSGKTLNRAMLLDANVQNHALSKPLLRFLDNMLRREARLQELTKQDFLTTFKTQNGSQSFVTQKLAMRHSPFDAMAVRINNLRIINDIYGFHHGDNCIKEVANRLAAIPGSGIRMDSGDLLWLSETTINASESEALVDSLSLPVMSAGSTIAIDLVLGIVNCPAQADGCEALFRRAWLTLEQACQSRCRFNHYCASLDKTYLRRLLIIAELESVFNGRDSEFSLFYQPKMNLATGQVEAAEALIRWHNPVLGNVFPDEFIPLAEQTGLLSKISYWVVSQAVRDLLVFRERDVPISVSINVSADDITDPRLLEHAVHLLQVNGLPASQLSFELTESQLLENPDQAIIHLTEFRKHGFRLAIDDFGTGYSSLAYLKRLPVDELKIDKSFVMQLDTQPDDQSIVQAILTLAQRFQLAVVAEGVEVPASLSLLHQWGCHWAQGYLVSRPLPQERFIEWFVSDESRTWQQPYRLEQ